jgi:hypothetical protein
MTLDSIIMARQPPAAINVTAGHAQSGGITHQVKPLCQRSAGVGLLPNRAEPCRTV